MHFTLLSHSSAVQQTCNAFSLAVKQNGHKNGPHISLCLWQSIEEFLSVAAKKLVWAGPAFWLELMEF